MTKARLTWLAGTVALMAALVDSGCGRVHAQGKLDAFLGFPPEPQELRARKIGHVVVKDDRPEFRGMIKTVRHLVTVEEVD